MSPTQDHHLAIRLADETATHERLVNVLRRRAPRVVAFAVSAEEASGLANAQATVRCTEDEAHRVAAYVGKIVGVERVSLGVLRPTADVEP